MQNIKNISLHTLPIALSGRSDSLCVAGNTFVMPAGQHIRIKNICEICFKEYSAKRSLLLRGIGTTCGIKCGSKKSANSRRGKRDYRGSNNPNWKGGMAKNHYHYKKLQMQRYPDRVEARRKVHVAVKAGKLNRGACAECGYSKTFAHHEDYSKPLEVIWLCRLHHREKHDNKY